MGENTEMKLRACYAKSVADFLQEQPDRWLREMKANFQTVYGGFDLSDDQIDAWKDCFPVMQKALEHAEHPEQSKIIFEYRLPYEGGRRPDVILLNHDQVVVLEFKRSARLYRGHMDQVLDYARDLGEYHFASRDKKIIPVLVLTGATNLSEKKHDVFVRSGDRLEIHCHAAEDVDLAQWLTSPYEPLPSIIEAAKAFANHEPLPQIRRAQSAGIDDAIACLQQATELAEREKRHVLAVVTGVPGSGKTFLGLKYVYGQDRNNAVFLSGNGPLIKVLKGALHNKTLVKSVVEVRDEYLSNQAPDYDKNILVFDEGQRAWDAEHMAEKRKVSRTEPEVLVEMMKKRCAWGVLLVLVGEGQAINKGEHGGVEQWAHAIDESWSVLCPDRFDETFSGAKLLQLENRQRLDLTTSLRTHLASDVSNFVNFLMDGNIKEARALLPEINKAHFHFYITHDLEEAKEYCKKRYESDPNGRCGLLASSKARGLDVYGIHNDFVSTQQVDFAAWYNEPMNRPGAGGNFNSVMTEFGCQGLELDMPIFCWGNDIHWRISQWEVSGVKTDEDRDYRINSYRVLLTRGRNGCIIFVPPETNYESTYEMLHTSVGIESLMA